MFNIIRKDWRANGGLISGILIWVLFMSLMSDQDPRSIVIMGIMCSAIGLVLMWALDFKNKGQTLVCSLPIDRNTFVQGSFLSSWLCILIVLLCTCIIISQKVLFSPELSAHLPEIMQLKVLLLSLWAPTLTMLAFFTIYIWFSARAAMISFLSVTFLLIGSIIGMLVVSDGKLNPAGQEVTPAPIALLKKTVMFFIDHHGTSTGLVISVFLLILVNFWTMKLGEFLFRRKDIVA